MKFKTRRFSRHHINRLPHVLPLAGFLLLCAAVLAGIFWVSGFSRADEASQPLPVGASATVPEFTEGSTTPVGGGSYFFTPATTTPAVTTPAVITIKPDQSRGRVHTFYFADGRAVYLMPDSHPAFLGTTNLKSGFIYINVDGPAAFYSFTQADNTGNWSWQSPETLPAGNYLITATAEDPFNSARSASARLNFAVGKVQPAPAVPRPARPAIYLFLRVLPEYKVIMPGQPVSVAVLVINRTGQGRQVAINYTITGERGPAADFSDTVAAPAGAEEFLKTFGTNPQSEPGSYAVAARVTFGGQMSVAADSFAIRLPIKPPALGRVMLDPATLLQILLVLFLLFAIIAYFEYNKVTVLSRFIKKVNEDDIEKEEKRK